MSARLPAPLTGPAARMAAATVATGLAGIGLTVLLHLIQCAAFGYTEETFLVGGVHASPLPRVAALAAGGLLAGAGWWLYRRLVTTPASVTAPVAGRDPLPICSSAPDAVLQIPAVGSGASLGREGHRASSARPSAAGSLTACASMPSTVGCCSPVAPVPGSPRSTTSRWAGHCSPSSSYSRPRRSTTWRLPR